VHRIEVLSRSSINFKSEGLISSLPIRVYNIKDKTLTKKELQSIEQLLSDPVIDKVATDCPVLENISQDISIIEMSPKPAVNDPEGKTVKQAIETILGRDIGDVSFAKQYVWRGPFTQTDYLQLQKQLGNPLINEFIRRDYNSWDSKKGMGYHFPEVQLPKVKPFTYALTKDGLVINKDTTNEQLMKISDERYIALNLEEMLTIKDLFKDPVFIKQRKQYGLEAMPTDVETESTGQSWSEHCIHKKFNAKWIYTSEDPNDEAGLPHITDSIFKSIIVDATEKIGRKIDYLVSVFEDNAGVIRLNNRYNLAHKVETHNHPSALDPFGGADTGSGGVFRDPKSTGIGMMIVSSQYGFRVAFFEYYKDLPSDILPPRKILDGIIAGVEDYGNRMGIPTMCGNVFVDNGWLKPAVYVGAVAVAPSEINGRQTHVKVIRPGYIALSLGGKVGKDGIHGATGSSDAIASDAEQREDVNQSVQIGDPIVEKNVFETINLLEMLGLIEASQDCGAGGWNSAVGELANLLNEYEKKRYNIQLLYQEKDVTTNTPIEEQLTVASPIIGDKKASPLADYLRLDIRSGEIFSNPSNGKGGVVMDLSRVPEKYSGLAGWEKLVSEAQEREVVVIKRENLDRVKETCKHLNVEATVIAEFNDSGYYRVIDQDKTIAYLPVDFLHKGLPQMTIHAHWKPCENKEPELPELEDLTETLYAMISSPNVQIYDWIMTRYDHEVQGGNLIKPIVGIGRGKSDAIAYRPVLGEKEVVIETWGSNPWQGDIDAYHMGRNNVVDAIGKIIAAGGNLDKITFNGNTTCPKPEKDEYVAAQVIRMIKGAADAEIAFGTPTISGKDSTSMERSYTSTKTDKDVHVKAKTELLKSAVGIVPDDSTLTTCDFKVPGDLIYVVGEIRDECGGSELYLKYNETGRNVPKSDFKEIIERYNAMPNSIKDKCIHSAQYVTKTGLFFGLANPAIAGDLGIDVTLDSLDGKLGRAYKIMGSESTGRFVVSVHPSKKQQFEEHMKGCYFRQIGIVRGDKEFNVFYKDKKVIQSNVDVLRQKNKGNIRL